jgi:hypothetical protein
MSGRRRIPTARAGALTAAAIAAGAVLAASNSIPIGAAADVERPPARQTLSGHTSQKRSLTLRIDARHHRLTSGQIAWVAQCPGGGTQRGIVLLPKLTLQAGGTFRLPLLIGSWVFGHVYDNAYQAVGALRIHTLAGCSTPLVHWKAQAPRPCTFYGDHDCDGDDPIPPAAKRP